MKRYIYFFIFGLCNFICSMTLYFLHIIPDRYEIFVITESSFILASSLSQFIICLVIYRCSADDNNVNRNNTRITPYNSAQIPMQIQRQRINQNYVVNDETIKDKRGTPKQCLYTCSIDNDMLSHSSHQIQIGSNDFEFVVIVNP